MQKARISYTCGCIFCSFRHLKFRRGFDPICSYPSVQKSCKVPCLFCFFLFYLALLIYLFPVSLPSLLCFQWRLRAARPEFDPLKMQRFLLYSTVFRQTKGNVQFIHSVHGKLLKTVKGPGLKPDPPSSSDKGCKCMEPHLHSRN